MYDYLIVGAGLYGAVFARELTKQGKSINAKALYQLCNCKTQGYGFAYVLLINTLKRIRQLFTDLLHICSNFFVTQTFKLTFGQSAYSVVSSPTSFILSRQFSLSTNQNVCMRSWLFYHTNHSKRNRSPSCCNDNYYLFICICALARHFMHSSACSNQYFEELSVISEQLVV